MSTEVEARPEAHQHRQSLASPVNWLLTQQLPIVAVIGLHIRQWLCLDTLETSKSQVLATEDSEFLPPARSHDYPLTANTRLERGGDNAGCFNKIEE